MPRFKGRQRLTRRIMEIQRYDLRTKKFAPAHDQGAVIAPAADGSLRAPQQTLNLDPPLSDQFRRFKQSLKRILVVRLKIG